MAPEELDVHFLLNPIKNVEPALPLVANQQGSEVKHVANDEPRPIIDAVKSEKQTLTKNIAPEEDDLVVEPGIKAERTDDVCETSINIHSCGVCCKTFENLHNLENHMVTHVRKSEDIEPCKECENETCQQHKKFPCNGCGKEFKEAHTSCSHHKRIRGKISAPMWQYIEIKCRSAERKCVCL